MTSGLGISKWLSLSVTDRKKYLKLAKKELAVKLQGLTYSQALKQTHQLFKLIDLLPRRPKKHSPVGIGVTLGTHKL
ncbi:MAG: hypothetical protein A3J83_04090 [Elusimicrobia bacterium RIFOXYA2_FULL_40_6]|nr:MAG: hypothetical protein A3J83_04090 [Elusimicrobia bacterium RIFOXYA2_FULL_40_6]